MLSKETVLDRIEIDEHGSVSVRRAMYVVEDGVRIAGPIYHRVGYTPGDDVAAESDRVKAVAAVIWTPEVVTEARDRKAQALAARQV